LGSRLRGNDVLARAQHPGRRLRGKDVLMQLMLIAVSGSRLRGNDVLM
jgi:hypothetical protein